MISKMDPKPEVLEGKVEAWLEEIAQKPSYPGFVVVNTDDPWDLFLCGTEVHGSCLSIDSQLENNKCLMGMTLNGTNRLIAVKDSTGRIKARFTLRLYYDENGNEGKGQAALFADKVYAQSQEDTVLIRALWEEGVSVADRLHLPLYTQEGTNLYPGELVSIEGPALYDLSDPAGGIQSKGSYSILDPNLYYKPT